MGLLDMAGGLGGLTGLLQKAQAGQHDQIAGDHAANAFQQVAGQLPPAELQQAAQEGVQQLPQEHQAQLAQHLGASSLDANGLAGMLTQLAGSGQLGALAQNPAVKMALMGIVAAAMRRASGGGGSAGLPGGLGGLFGR